MEMEVEESGRAVKCYYSGKVSSTHRLSKSDSERTGTEENFGSTPEPVSSKQVMETTEDCSAIKKMLSPDAEVQNLLKQEILQLEKRLLDQFKNRCALENALGCDSSAMFSSNDSSIMPKYTKELIREISSLELEVMYLEKYLLSLYRKAFNHQLPTLSTPTDDREPMPLSSHLEMFQATSTIKTTSEKGVQSDHVVSNPISAAKSTIQEAKINCQEKLTTYEKGVQSDHVVSSTISAAKSTIQEAKINCQEKLTGLDVQRSNSSLSQRATSSARISPSEESMARALRSCHSQPLSFLKEEKNHVAREISLAEYLGANIDDHVPETPNKLSEEMVRCMCAIYCKLAEPPLTYHGPPSSPVSLHSSIAKISPNYITDSHIHKEKSILRSWLINLSPFQAEGRKEFSEPYSSMVEIRSISKEPRRLRDVQEMLKNYKSIVLRLRKVEPMKMKHEEKLAFWINIHNALVMHAYIECGIPVNNIKKTSLLIKASCIVGGLPVNAAIIRGTVLCCRTHCPDKWLQSLLHSRLQNKVGDQWQGYCIDRQEPVLHFALCSGSHSDPTLRVYTPKRIFQQLEAAKEAFIQGTVRIFKKEKILVPKIVALYAKEMKLSSQALSDMVQRHLSETLKMPMQRFPQHRTSKIIEFEHFNFNFRYLLQRELLE